MAKTLRAGPALIDATHADDLPRIAEALRLAGGRQLLVGASSVAEILGAGLLKTKDLLESTVPVDWGHMALGVVVSAVTAYLTIMLFLRLLDRVGMLPFMVYRLLLGAVLFVWFV